MSVDTLVFRDLNQSNLTVAGDNFKYWPSHPKNVDQLKSGQKWHKMNHLATSTNTQSKSLIHLQLTRRNKKIRWNRGLTAIGKFCKKWFLCSSPYEIGFFNEPAFLSIIFQLTKEHANVFFRLLTTKTIKAKKTFLKVKQ